MVVKHAHDGKLAIADTKENHALPVRNTANPNAVSASCNAGQTKCRRRFDFIVDIKNEAIRSKGIFSLDIGMIINEIAPRPGGPYRDPNLNDRSPFFVAQQRV